MAGRIARYFAAPFLLAFVSVLLMLPTQSVLLAGKVSSPFRNVLTREANSKELCEQVPNRIFVTSITGTECIAYFTTTGYEWLRQAVIFFDGDTTGAELAKPDGQAKALEERRALLQQWADRLRVRYVYVSRVGLNGSSGNHGDRRKPHETMIMNVAVDRLKERLDINQVILAGQSGGSTIAASMLTMGRDDVACAVLGSGALELVKLEHERLTALKRDVDLEDLEFTMYDPSANVDGVVKDNARRIWILGDPADSRTPFDQQKRFGAQLRALGHHAVAVAIHARGENDHGAARSTIPAAGACARGDTDDLIVRNLNPKRLPSVTTANSQGD